MKKPFCITVMIPLIDKDVAREAPLLGVAGEAVECRLVDVRIVQLLGRVDEGAVEGGRHHMQQVEVVVPWAFVKGGRVQR